MRALNQRHNSKECGGVIISPFCPCRCLFCSSALKLTGKEMRRQKIKALKNLLEFKRKGITRIEITGADPIEYDEICDFIKFIKGSSFDFVQLSTHGMRLNDDKFLRELVDSGVTRLRIPIYGSRAKIHDSVTRTKGSFEAIYNGLKKLRCWAPSIELQISCLIMKQNRNDLIAIVDLIKSLDAHNFYFSIPCVFNGDFSYVLPYQKLSKYVKRIIQHCDEIGLQAFFLEIPYCIFGKKADYIDNCTLPPDLGENCQPPEMHKSEIKDLPSYRLKTKVEICGQCICSNSCDGFLVNYVEKFGVKGIEPLIGPTI